MEEPMSRSEKKPITRLSAVPASLGAVLLLGAVALGANGLRPDQPAEAKPSAGYDVEVGPAVAAARRADADALLDGPEKPAPVETAKPKPTEAAEPMKPPKPVATPKASAEPKPTEKPAPVETDKPKPTEKPAPPAGGQATLVLEGWAKEHWAKLAWKPYLGDGFEVYKVVRSADATIGWPAAGGDALVGVVGAVDAPWFADEPPCGTAWFYRVFAVRSTDAGYQTLAASNVVGVTVACAPKPTPVVTQPIALEAHATAGVGVELAWQACEADGFAAYKVVRSTTHADPRYPLNDGSELIAVIGDPAETWYTDGPVPAGETWTYRVVAKGEGGILCQSPAVSVTGE
jgi:hypothetical protein